MFAAVFTYLIGQIVFAKVQSVPIRLTIGALFAGLAFSRDPEERAELARRAQEILADEAVWAYLYQPAWIVATRSDVEGIALFHDLTLRYGFLGKK